MSPSLNRALACLTAGETLTISETEGRGVAVFLGRLAVRWSADGHERTVGAGESLMFDRAGAASARALEECHVVLIDAPRPAP